MIQALYLALAELMLQHGEINTVDLFTGQPAEAGISQSVTPPAVLVEFPNVEYDIDGFATVDFRLYVLQSSGFRAVIAPNKPLDGNRVLLLDVVERIKRAVQRWQFRNTKPILTRLYIDTSNAELFTNVLQFTITLKDC